MSNLPGDEWMRRRMTEESDPPMTRLRAQVEIDFLYGTGKISREYWSKAFDNLSFMLCADYRYAIAPEQCNPVVLQIPSSNTNIAGPRP